MASPATPKPTDRVPARSYTAVEHDDWTLESNSHTEEEIREIAGAPTVSEEESEAAKRLGKKGGDAAAKAKKAKAKDEADDAPEKAEAKAKAPIKAAEEEDDELDPKPAKGSKEYEAEGEKRRRDARERVLEATRKAATLDRENKRLQTELEEARKAKPAPEEKPKSQVATDDDPEPDPDDLKYAEGQFDPAYVKDAGRWAARQEFREQQAKTAQRTREDSARRYVEARGAAVDEAIADAGGDEFLDSLSEDVRAIEPSFMAMSRNEKPRAVNALGDEFLRLGKDAPRLMRYLTENPDVLQRLTSPTLSPWQFEREMGRVEERLGGAATTDKPATPKPTSRAPRPASSVAGAPTNADAEPDPRSSSYDEHAAYYNARDRRRSA